MQGLLQYCCHQTENYLLDYYVNTDFGKKPWQRNKLQRLFRLIRTTVDKYAESLYRWSHANIKLWTKTYQQTDNKYSN